MVRPGNHAQPGPAIRSDPGGRSSDKPPTTRRAPTVGAGLGGRPFPRLGSCDSCGPSERGRPRVTDTLQDLSEDECLELLAAHTVGRIAVVADGLPLVFP